MKIAINALSAQVGGGVSAFVNLMPALANVDKRNQYTIFVSSRQKEILSAIPDGFKNVVIDYIPQNPFVRVAWEQIIFPFYLWFYKIDVLYSVGNITTLSALCKVVLLIENSNPYSIAKTKWPWKEQLRNKFLKCLGWLSAKRANKIRFVSNNSRKILIKQLNLAEDKCVTIYHGVNDDSGCEKNDFQLPYKYILTVAVVAPHKNLEILVRAFRILTTEYHYAGNLVIVGDLCYPEYAEKLRIIISELELSNKVVFVGRVEHKYVKHYYKNADAFVLPSVAETFGIPAIEAMSYGVPVVVSDSSHYENYFIPFREICGGAAHYFDPFDPDSMAQSIYKVISDPLCKEELLLNCKKQIKKYDWELTAKFLVEEFNKMGEMANV